MVVVINNKCSGSTSGVTLRCTIHAIHISKRVFHCFLNILGEGLTFTKLFYKMFLAELGCTLTSMAIKYGSYSEMASINLYIIVQYMCIFICRPFTLNCRMSFHELYAFLRIFRFQLTNLIMKFRNIILNFECFLKFLIRLFGFVIAFFRSI